MKIDPVTGKIGIFNGDTELVPSSVATEQSYERSGGKPNKIISKVFGLDEAFFAQPLKNLDVFDCVYAIDTNYQTINGVKVCVAGITRGEKSSIVVPGKTAYHISLKYCLMFSTYEENPERIAWAFVTDQARYWESNPNKNIGLIVDSDLPSLSAVSNRKEAIFRQFYLPSNFRIMYASADAEKGNPMNKMISYSDSAATQFLNEVIKQLGSHDVSKVPIEFCLWSVSLKDNQTTYTKMIFNEPITAPHA